MANMILTRKCGQRVSFMVFDAPMECDMRPIGVRIEDMIITIQYIRIDSAGLPNGPVVDKVFTSDNAVSIPDWCEPIRSRYISYIVSAQERKAAMDNNQVIEAIEADKRAFAALETLYSAVA